ncbi:hypothetical protein [Arthrobacter sp. Z1-15]
MEQNLVHLCARLINIDDHHTGYAITATMGASAVNELVLGQVNAGMSSVPEPLRRVDQHRFGTYVPA